MLCRCVFIAAGKNCASFMDDFTALKSKIKKITLLPAEKAAILKRVASFVDSRTFVSRRAGPGYFLGWRFAVPAFLALFVAVSAVTTWAAEGALPGDVLYSVKTKINEEVKSFLAFNTKAKAELEGRLAAERLAEAGELAARGKLTPESTKKIEARLSEHAARLKAGVAKLGAAGQTQEAVESVAKIDELIQNQTMALRQEQNVDVTALVNQAENIKSDLQKTAVQTETLDSLTDNLLLEVKEIENAIAARGEAGEELEPVMVELEKVVGMISEIESQLANQEYLSAAVLLQRARALLGEIKELVNNII